MTQPIQESALSLRRFSLRQSFHHWAALALLCAACGKTDPHPAPTVDELREFIVSGAAPEETGSQLLGDARNSHRELLDQLEDAVEQPKVKGVFLRLTDGFGGAWARASELREALQAVRAAKKPVHCYFDNADNSGYALLAGSCDRISMAPTGLLSLTGVQAQVIYARDMLDQLGVRAELLQVGRFKGAADALTRSDMPNEVREVLSQLLDDLQAGLADSVMTGRSLDATAFAAALDSGPQTPQRALEQKLVDAVAFDDEARSKAKEAAKAERVKKVQRSPNTEHVDLFDVLKVVLGGSREKPEGKRIALVYLEGEIRDDSREQGTGSMSGPFISTMRRFADEKDVQAVVLRIDSPGGSALASDKMWHAVRRVAKRKPVIVSIGDMAASGGYYVACAGTEIFAEDSSIVGSIGVVGGKIVVAPLAERVGVHATELSRGKNAGWMSPFTPFSDTERSAVLQAMTQTYETFLSRVRDGRKIEDERLSAVAEGRIMTGKRAREGGLVDNQGGLQKALATARSKSGVGEDVPVEVWPKERSLLERVSQMFGETHAQAGLPWPSVIAALPFLARSPLAVALVRGDIRPLAALPYALELH
jgi:protease IV